jgi:signal transduction histidine kinase
MSAWVRRRSLRVQVFVIIVLTIGPAFALALFGARVERDKDRARAEADLWRVLDLVAGAHQITVDETRQLLGALRRIPAVAHHDSACAAVLAEVQAGHSEYLDLGVATPEGRIACGVSPAMESASAAAAPWFQRAVATRAFAQGDFEIGTVARHPVVVLAEPVVEAGAVRAVVFAAINLDSLRRLAAVTSLPAGAALVLARRDGLVLARHPDPTFYWTGQTLPETPLFRSMRTQGKGVTTAPGIDQNVRIWVFQPMGSGDAWLAIGFPPDIVYGPSAAALARNLVVLAAVALASLSLAWLGTRAALRPLDDLATIARRLARGELDARPDHGRGPAEINLLSDVFDEMAAAVAAREASLRDSAASLAARTDELHLLLERMAAVREDEATRISREVHDVIGQALTALRMDVAWTRKHLADAAGEDGRAALLARVNAALALIDSTTQAVRRVATSLRPTMLDDLGLAAAIEWQAQDLTTRAGLAVRLDLDPDIALPEKSATAVFRIFQEIGTNVVRHARASSMSVRLFRDGARVVLEAADDGAGMPPEGVWRQRSLGILGMRERAAQCGGTVSFAAGAAGGTVVTVVLPAQEPA